MRLDSRPWLSSGLAKLAHRRPEIPRLSWNPSRARGATTNRVSVVLTGRALWTMLSSFLLWSFPVALLLLDVAMYRVYAWDFRAFYSAGHAYLHLHSPYVSASLANLTSRQNFVYPMPIAAIFAPLSVVPFPVAAAFFIAVSAAALCLALRLLDIRDWRCYVAVLVGFPAYFGLKLGTLSPILTLLLALLWRYRNRTWIAFPTLTLLILAKLFLWPLALWLLFMRRFRTVFSTVVVSAGAVLLSSVTFGLSTLIHYPTLLHGLSNFEGPFSLSIFGLGTQVGLSTNGALLVSVAVGAFLLLRALYAARSGDESLAFRLTIVAALALSPIVWDHYLLLLYVPLALFRPRFSIIWFGCAWIGIDGFVLTRPIMAVLTSLLWVIIAIQTGILPKHGLTKKLRLRVLLPRVSLLGLCALWIGLIGTIAMIIRVIPVVAALRPTTGDMHASGSALLRLEKHGTGVCWRVLTTGIPAGSRVAIVHDRPKEPLMVRSLGSRGVVDTCSEFSSSTAATRLVHAFEKKSAPQYSIAVTSPDGRALLSGPILRPEDAGVRSAALAKTSR
jgi:alpha-1,2-mannosyltransferase